MGLRPEVFGVSLEHVWHNVIGSMSQADALAFYEKYVKKMFTDEKEQNEARTFVLSLLKDGAEAVASVEEEKDVHYWPIIQLIVSKTRDDTPKQVVSVDSNMWKSASDVFEWLSEMFPKAKSKSSPDQKTAASLLLKVAYGRPLIGQAFDSEWTYYSYLTNKELKLVVDELRKLKDPKDAYKVLPAFLSWADAILADNLDLFMFAQ